MLKVPYQIKKQTSEKTSDVQKSAASGEDKILASIEAMKVELRAEMKAEIVTVKKSVSLDEKIPQFKSSKPSNYFDSHQARPRQASFVKRGCNHCRQTGKAEEYEHCKKCGSVDHFHKGCQNKGNPQRLHLRYKSVATEVAKSHHCNFCGKNEVPGRRNFKLCSRCKSVRYCQLPTVTLETT